MRQGLFTSLILAVVPAAAFAQSTPYLAVVADAGTKLRAGPTDQFPETATLPKGTQLLVDHEEPNGWLAVQDAPGRVGSVSWVQTQFVNFEKNSPIPQLVEVDEAGTTLRAGQMGLAQPLPIQRAKIPGGTILTVIGKGVEFEGKTWYPVVPPPGDFRYLPKQAVKFEKSTNSAFTVREPAPPASPPPAPTSNPGVAPVAAISGPSGGMLPPSGGPGTPVGALNTAAKPSVQHPLWIQAEAAEREGRFDDAEKLFFQLARVMNEPGGDHDIANLCYTRIHTLREKKRNGTSSSGNTGGSSSGGSLPPIGAPTRPVGGDSAKPASGGPPAEPRGERSQWHGPGRLVRSALALDGRKTYALESSPGIPTAYVVAAKDVDLDKFLNKKVEVYGPSATRRDLPTPKPVITASAAELVQ